MTIKLNTNFDPYFETLGLLIYSDKFETNKINVIEELNTFGIAGNAFYETHFRIWEDIVLQFDAQKKTNANYDFFFCVDCANHSNFTLLLMAIVIDHVDLIKSQTTTLTMMQSIITECLSEICCEETMNCTDIQKDFYGFLSLLETCESEKWKLYTLFQKPLEYFRSLIDLIELNLPVYQKLYDKKEVRAFVSQQINMIENSNEKTILDSLTPQQIIYPTLIHPLVQIALETKYYYGLLNANIFQSEDFTETIDEMLLVKLKALADKSKLQILYSLKKKAMYNLELAELLQLSAGTISHHMNVLLATNLVRVEKEGGRVYYHLDEDGIQSIIAKLKTLLFD